MLLNIKKLSVNYGAIRALDGVNIEAEEGEILSIIGANGAGKSTLLKTITGIVKPAAGEIVFNSQSIRGIKTNSVVKLGITMVPEGRKIFPDLTVKENLELGAYSLRERTLKKELFDLVMSNFPRLKERIRQHAGTLSGGEQQMLAMGRALMSNPKLLLLDEPSMGLSPIITREIFALIRLINTEKRIAMILVEQNAHMALEHSNRTYVLENGRITMQGASVDIKSNSRIIEAYLGV
jgi:branched-chain amino acid transport system ATP-binding protein